MAFVLAFLFRTFEAEAFVIPTGSMATTLMGRHKDVTCVRCGYPFQVSASAEMDPRTGEPSGNQVVSGTCPMCRYTMDFGSNNPQRPECPSFTGDRILVAKFPYFFVEPQRWEVAVFRYPGGATTNYIKRIVGLPFETIIIRHGNLWVRREGEQVATIARKPPAKVRAMLQPVFDNDYVPKLIELGWPARWLPDGPSGVPSGWTASDNHRVYRADGTAPGEVWLRYHHFVPSSSDWQRLAPGAPPPAAAIRPQLISDFVAYNTDTVMPAYGRQAVSGPPWEFPFEPIGEPGRPYGPSPQSLGLHWVGDLALEVVLEVQSQAGEVVLELVKGGYRFRCSFDVATGRARLSISGQEGFGPTAQTAVRGPGKYRVLLANVDDQLLLWVNDRLVQFDAPTTYDELGNRRPQEADLSPVAIASRGAALTVRHLKIFRDAYYIADRDLHGSHFLITDFDRVPPREGEPDPYPYRLLTHESVAEFMSSPNLWDAFTKRREVEFRLGADQFLVLGDNSAESKDSRLWGSEYYVRRDLLIGKALFIYWPHSWDRLPYIRIPFPFFPNFARMGFVR